MALHGSASANLAPILFKNNSLSLEGLNVIIHDDKSESMNRNKPVCISVIDESSPSASITKSDWINFRNSFPDRIFWILQPGGSSQGSLNQPTEFTNDPLAFGPIAVNRDSGNVNSRSDWFTICNLGSLTPGSVISLAVDNSGSMTTSTVSASINFLRQRCSETGLILNEITYEDERWVLAQNRTLNVPAITNFYTNGSFIGDFQDELLLRNIGKDISQYPNIYAYFDVNSRNSSTSFTISNPNGSLNINQSFMRGESTGSATTSNWIGSNYISNITNHTVNVCTNVVGSITGGRLNVTNQDQLSEDVHGNLWSIFTTPNAISTGIAGRYGSVIQSNVRKGSTTVIITNSNEQFNCPTNMTNVDVIVGTSSTVTENFDGLGARRYAGYFGDSNAPTDFDTTNDNVNYADSLTSIEGPLYLEQFNRFFAGDGPSRNDTTWVIQGFFLAPTTGTYTFFTNSDDASYLWIGNNALSGYTKENAVVKNGGKHPTTERSGNVNLTAGVSYPIRVIYGNYKQGTTGSPTELTISFSGPGISKRTDGRGYYFSRNVSTTTNTTRKINGVNGEMNFRKYRIFTLSSYTSTDGFDGVLFYGSNLPQPYGYVGLTTTSYRIIRSSNPPSNWSVINGQTHDTLTLASETRGGLFKIQNINDNNQKQFAICLAEFISTTL